MLFGRQKKKDEEFRQYVDAAVRRTGKDTGELGKKLSEKLEGCIEVLEKRLGERLDENAGKLEEGRETLEKELEEQLRQGREESARLLRRQSGSLEDILEELQRQDEERQKASGELEKLRKREKELVELCCLIAGQREMIVKKLLAEGVLAEDVRAGWRRQAELMVQEAAGLERRCTLQEIGACGEKVDYDCHEILSVCATGREELGGTVAEVFSTGYCYEGRVVKKAQVAVYKYEECVNGS